MSSAAIPTRRGRRLLGRALFALVLAGGLSAALGCSGRSAYVRAEAPAEELVWAWDGELQLRSGDNVAVANPPDWEGLSDAVACVPRARAYAEQAESDGGLGQVLSWSALGVLGGGLAASVALGAVGLVSILAIGPAGVVLAAGLLFVGAGASLTATFALLGVGAHLIRAAVPEALDAVNAYNDRFAEEAACRSAPSGPAATEGRS